MGYYVTRDKMETDVYNAVYNNNEMEMHNA